MIIPDVDPGEVDVTSSQVGLVECTLISKAATPS